MGRLDSILRFVVKIGYWPLLVKTGHWPLLVETG
jgi:hypothetical protein